MAFNLVGTGQLVKAAGVIAKLIAKERKSTTLTIGERTFRKKDYHVRAIGYFSLC